MSTTSTNYSFGGVATTATTVGMAGLLLLGGAAASAPAMAADTAPVGEVSAAVAGSHSSAGQVVLHAPSDATTGDSITLKGKVKKTHHHKTRVVIQKKHGKHWQKVDATKTNKKGKFHTADAFGKKHKVKLRAKAKGHGVSATQLVTFTNPTPPPPPPPPAPQTQSITWDSNLGGEHVVGDSMPLKAHADSGETVTYTTSNRNVAGISGNTLTFTGPGDATITATVPGDANWKPASTAKTLTVTPNPAPDGPTCVVKDGDQVVFKGDGNGQKVDDSPNESLQQAIDNAAEGDTLTLTGTCSGKPDPNGGSAESGLGLSKDLTVKGQATDRDPRAALITQKTASGGLSNVVGIGKNINVTFTGALDINGYTPDAGEPVEAGGVMFIDTGSNVTVDSNVVLTGGYAENGGSIYVNEDGTLNLKGTVVHGYAKDGGGIQNYGTVNLNGGTIGGDTEADANTADAGGGTRFGHGGGIENIGTVNLNSGAITGNTAEEGGGIANYVTGTVNLVGGSITGNTAEKGGGIYNWGTLNGRFNGQKLPDPQDGASSWIDGQGWQQRTPIGSYKNEGFDIYYL